ncbi:MAG: HAD family hydrolase, partial [Microcystaceae cyanobacterium]
MLKVILFDFNGVIINDEAIHQQLISEIVLGENLRPISWVEHQKFCLGKSDRVCLRDLLNYRGRSLTEDYLDRLVEKKAKLYRNKINSLETLPIYPGVKKFIEQIQLRQIPLGLVTGAVRSEVVNILEKAQLLSAFSVIVTGDDIITSKPQPDGYLLAVEKFNQLDSSLDLTPKDCLAIEDTLVGIQAAKTAGMSVVGIAHTFPYHFLQRYANWAIDSFSQLDLDRVQV